VPVYRVLSERGQDPVMWARFLHERVDAVTFTSPSTVRHLVELLDADAGRVLGRTTLACIGPVTAEAIRARGLAVGPVAETYTIPGLVEALRQHFGRAAAVAVDRGEER